MSQPSSFIFSSDRTKPARASTALFLGAWVIIGLVVIDTLINVVFSYPSDPKVINPSQLRSYFDYGRSQDGKLRRMTRSDKTQTAPITLAGWYDPLEIWEPATDSNSKVVTFYGMSHAVNLAHALGRVSDRYVPRSWGRQARPRIGPMVLIFATAEAALAVLLCLHLCPATWR